MLEKIGLPAKPSLRGNNWVVDASHCQGCSSQFTFINRKHHCRRCGGLFCGSCTQQRMFLRGQGDSPVRICEPCKKLEEAARFEKRTGHKNRAGRGGSKLTSNTEEEALLNQILGNEGKDSISSAGASTTDVLSSALRTTSNASCSGTGKVSTQDGEILKSLSLDQINFTDVGSVTPEELRQQAIEERKKYKTLKAEGKPEEALKAFKRGKELERQAGALELSLRKNRKRTLISSKDDSEPSGRENKISAPKSEGKDDLAHELKELGWSDMDLRTADKRPATLSLESELSTLLGEVSGKTSTEKRTHAPDKSQVIAHKKKALELKRAGNLAEAKEELKKAKLLEKQIEEQELLGEAEESDDELSSLIRSIDDSKDDDLSVGYDLHSTYDFDPQLLAADDLGVDDNFDVEDEDMVDPEIAAALTSLGWTEETADSEDISSQTASIDKEALKNEIISLKREALHKKREGNTAEAMVLLKKAKGLEVDLESCDSLGASYPTAQGSAMIQKGSGNQHTVKASGLSTLDVEEGPKLATKSKLMIQKELLALKKKALLLRREGKVDEAEEELKKGKVLEKQLEEMDKAPKTVQLGVSNKPTKNMTGADPEDEDAVTDQDLHDPTYLSLLKNMGWKDDDEERIPSTSIEMESSTDFGGFFTTQASGNIATGVSGKSKAEIQRELLGLKKRALVLRREGKLDEAEEELKKGKLLEKQLEEMDKAPKTVQLGVSNKPANNMAGADPEDEDAVTDRDLRDPTYLSLLKNMGWKDDAEERIPSTSIKTESSAEISGSFTTQASGNIMTGVSRKSKGEIQRELLGLKRKALGLRRQGDVEGAEEVLNMAKLLEEQLAEIETPSLKAVAAEPEPEVKYNAKIGSSLENANIPLPSDSKKRSTEDSGSREKTTPRNLDDPAKAVANTSTIASNPNQTTNSQNDQSTLQEDILAHKRKAVMLKREGKLAEAKEELRQAKLLEKHLEEKAEPSTSSPDMLGSKVPSDVRKEESSNAVQKPLSGRDRFKLQQESLGHKRKALKLRREGRTEEADAELELAKALEAQLEDSAAHDSTSFGAAAEQVDDVSVEDFLDPQLVSALKALGIPEASGGSRGPQGPVSEKSPVVKVDSSTEEKRQLEEQIKAEKLKALNLKRSGKQADALDALRQAKLYEKKLNSLS